MSAEHSHDTREVSDTRLVLAVALNVLLTFAQILGGVVSGSLALIADALHNFSDAASLGLALYARRIGKRPADKLATFGYERAELVAALVNLTTLVVVGVYLLIEGFNRVIEPQPIDGWTVIWVAGIALGVDVVTAFIVYAGSKNNLNMKAAFLHNVSDALASVGVVVSGALILLFDLVIADLVVTAAIAAYVIYQGVSLLPKTIRLLMDSVPDDLSFDEVVEALHDLPGVAQVHHVHIWSLSEHRRALEAHLVPVDNTLEAFDEVKRAAREMLAEKFSIKHSTLEACL